MRIVVKVLLGGGLAAILGYLYYTEVKPVVIFGLRSDYAHAIPFQKIPEGLTSLRAESCGQCHREIYDEWKTSIHAHAYEDPSVSVVTVSYQDRPSFITWDPVGPMQNTKASSSCRNGALFAKVATCLKSIGRLQWIVRSDVDADTSGVVGTTPAW